MWLHEIFHDAFVAACPYHIRVRILVINIPIFINSNCSCKSVEFFQFKKGFFKCFVCSFNPAKGRNRQAAKDENFDSSKSIEAHGDGRLHSSEKFCQLCLRNDVCGGLKTLDDAGTRAVYVHQTCMLSVNEAYNKGDKIAFICGKKDKSIHYCPTVKLNRMLIDSISKVSYI